MQNSASFVTISETLGQCLACENDHIPLHQSDMVHLIHAFSCRIHRLTHSISQTHIYNTRLLFLRSISSTALTNNAHLASTARISHPPHMTEPLSRTIIFPSTRSTPHSHIISRNHPLNPPLLQPTHLLSEPLHLLPAIQRAAVIVTQAAHDLAAGLLDTLGNILDESAGFDLLTQLLDGLVDCVAGEVVF